MNRIFYFLLLLLLPSDASSQANCGNPVHVTLCPSTTLTNQTNAGMIDDSPAPCNIVGEDLVYEIYAPNNALHIYVSLINATGPSKLTLKTGTCNSSTCYSYIANTGNSNIGFTVTPSNYYYLWVDAASTITFGISIGGDTSSQYVYIPNTQGLLEFDHCASQPFAPSKPFYEVQFNGAYQSQPMTMSPLNVPATLCITFYLRNWTGVSGPKNIDFLYDPGGIINITPVSSTVPGFYNSGNWIAGTPSYAIYPFTFSDSAGIGRGDFDGNPNSCLRYQFCFNITPISNDPVRTNVHAVITSDTYGMGFAGYVRSGCCPSGMPVCLGNNGGPSGSASSIGFSFNDPGSPLPVSLLNFDASVVDNFVRLDWTTASEINCDYFTIEKSIDGIEWNELNKTPGAGNSSVVNHYSAKDDRPLNGTSFYRLKQTDYDGTASILKTETIKFSSNKINIYPIPADKFLRIEGKFNRLNLFSSFGEKVNAPLNNDGALDLSHLKNGIYILELFNEGEITFNKIIINHE